ncbi:hypothetical protein HWV00_21270 (plasmid) [Moritella sp. 24]|uniref:hypothetical protein n=1 Tax=Moritella sp. 24 TaxID=2746230 RepID=UPI001BAD4ECB|nr:hypothetical protein [Moritella sp. 24]QUM78807.1 hypothetical protein HWV00_21270 [Moritella sp. 24]
MNVIVKTIHKSDYPNPISFSEGESLILGHLDTEFIGWIRTITKDGNEGWAPVDYIEMSQCKTKGIAKSNYNAFELDTEINESLRVISELNEWFFVINASYEKGWVPMETVGIA